MKFHSIHYAEWLINAGNVIFLGKIVQPFSYKCLADVLQLSLFEDSLMTALNYSARNQRKILFFFSCKHGLSCLTKICTTPFRYLTGWVFKMIFLKIVPLLFFSLACDDSLEPFYIFFLIPLVSCTHSQHSIRLIYMNNLSFISHNEVNGKLRHLSLTVFPKAEQYICFGTY